MTSEDIEVKNFNEVKSRHYYVDKGKIISPKKRIIVLAFFSQSQCLSKPS
ncbi:MAG: hypothetical protein J6328_04285 [Bacilli bacterium]|nr:hypothetical protein [Bacilli bacterium]